MRKAREGDTILVHISGSLDDGTEFATSGGEVPIELTINDGMRISALQQSALGMAVGEKKTVRLEPDQAFGEMLLSSIIKIINQNSLIDVQIP